MRYLFKRNSPPPPVTVPASPFPTVVGNREGCIPSIVSPRSRGFSFTKDGATSPAKLIPAPIVHKHSSPPEAHISPRKRLQSGGITFDEVLPVSTSPPVPLLLPQPSGKVAVSAIEPVSSSYQCVPVVKALDTLSTKSAGALSEDPVSNLFAGISRSPLGAGSPRPAFSRPRRGTNEVGQYTPHIDALIVGPVPATGALESTLARPKEMTRRVSSYDDLTKYPKLANKLETSKPTTGLFSPALSIPPPHIVAHQSSSPALHLLPNPPLSAEKLTTTTPSPVTKPALRRPALYRGVELRDSSRAMQGAKAGANTVLEPPVDPLEENYLARSTLPSGMRKMSTTKGPSISPLLTGAHPVSQFQPASPVTPGPHTPLSTSSLSPNYSKDTHPGIPFPREPASPRTILTPPADPQIELALRVDATRISLGRYDIEQDLTFSVRVENAVADDVEVQLVTTKEGAETVYELKIRKKDPYGMRVRDGIIPYTYVPPFSSVSSSLGWSSMCSSPVTTPPLEVPPFHQYGSYFPSQYVSGGMWRTPKRASISKGSRSSRASSSTVRTPTASFRHYSPTTVFPVGHTLLPSSPAGKAAEARIALTQYDSDADDSDDGESVLDHYARRPAYSAPTLSPSVSVREPGVQYRHEIARNDGSLLGDNVSASYENANGMKVITDGYPGLKSHFSDTEAEGETEIEGGDSSDEVVLPAEIRQ